MKNMKRADKRRKIDILHGNNGGNSLILVIVVMFVVMLLGMAILYSSYTSYILRVSQRKSEKTFSSAETGMSMLRDGLVSTESDAIAAGYQALISSFSTSSEANQATFIRAFLKELSSNSTTLSDTESSKYVLFPGSDTGENGTVTKYDVRALDAYLRNRVKKGDNYKLEVVDPVGSSDTEKNYGRVHVLTETTKDKDGKDKTRISGVVLRNVRLTYYTNKIDSTGHTENDNYAETITSDFRLNIPEASTVNPEYGFSNPLENFTAIADKGVTNGMDAGARNAGGTFNGMIYAGKFTMRNGDMTVPKNMSIIVGKTRAVKEVPVADGNGTIKVEPTNGRPTSGEIVFTGGLDQGGNITVEDGANLWTHGIKLKVGSKLVSGRNSHIYVANDLEFINGGTATIGGSYIGFGNGSTPDTSSSIIFGETQINTGNGNNTSLTNNLDISNAQQIVLAGTSFVKQSSRMVTRDTVRMGSSITARAEQLAYLVPKELFNTISSGDGTKQDYTNPRVLSTNDLGYNDASEDPAYNSIDDKAFRKKVNGMKKPLSEYGITNKATGIKMLTFNVPGTDQRVRYYFFDFGHGADYVSAADQNNANMYFKDYFSSHADDMNSYIESYASLNGFDTNYDSVVSNGTTLKRNKSGKYEAIDGGSVDDAYAADYQARYQHLSETLTQTTAGQTTPFYQYINADHLHKMCRMLAEEANNYEKTKDAAQRIIVNENSPVVYRFYKKDSNGAVHSDKYVVFCASSIKTISGNIPHIEYIMENGKRVARASNGGIFETQLTKAFIADGDINIDSGGETLTDGSGVHGIVMCSGRLNIRNGHVMISNEFYDYLEDSEIPIPGSTGSDGKTQYFKLLNEGGTGGDQEEAKSWDPDDMVKYENWSKD